MTSETSNKIYNSSEDEPQIVTSDTLEEYMESIEIIPSLATKITFFIVMTSILFGLSYAGDPAVPVQDIILDSMKITSTQYGMFASLYSFPNIIFVLFGGVIVDEILGVRWSAFLFSFIIFLGHSIFTAGIFWNSYICMACGRFIVGVGGESLSVATSKYIVLWFKNNSLTLMFSIQLSIVRLASVSNILFAQKIYEYYRNKYPKYENTTCLSLMYIIGVIVCFFSVICSIIAAFIDKTSRKSILTPNSSSKVLPKNNECIRKNFFTWLKQILDLGTPFYLISMSCVIFYAGFPSFTQFSISHLENKYWKSGADAALVISVYSIVGIVASPIAGFLVSLIGYDVIIVFLAILLCSTTHLAFTFTFMNPYLMIVLVGISTTFVNCVLWPLVAYVVPENKIGIGYGIMQCIQNLGLTLSPFTAGAIVDSYGFFTLQIYIIAISSISAMCWSCLFIADFIYCNGILNASQKIRTKINKEIIVNQSFENMSE